MSLRYNPQTVTDGLQLYLDASNNRSRKITNYHPYALDMYAFRTDGVRCTLSRDTTTNLSPARGIPMKMVPTQADPYQSTINSSIYNIFQTSSGDTWTFSVWVKAAFAEQSPTVSLYIFDALSDGSNVTNYWSCLEDEPIGTDWTRLSLTRTLEHSGTTYVQVRIDGPSDGSLSYWDGAQMERGSGMTEFTKNWGPYWWDMSNNRSHATHYGITYFSGLTNDSYYNFDGYDDYVDFYAPNLTASATTVEMWVKVFSPYASRMIMGFYAYDIYFGGGGLGFNTSNSDVYGINGESITSLGLIDNWKHYVFVFRADVPYTNNKMYVNGQLQSLSQITGTENSTNRNFNNGQGRISGWKNNNNYRLKMDCSIFKVYNRELTQDEITKNFNLTKRRFGL